MQRGRARHEWGALGLRQQRRAGEERAGRRAALRRGDRTCEHHVHVSLRGTVAVADSLGLAYTLCADAQTWCLIVTLRLTLLALGLAGGTEAEALDDE